MKYKYKIGDKVRIPIAGQAVWVVRWIHNNPCPEDPYFLSTIENDNWRWGVERLMELVEPAKPRESRKALRKRIKWLEHNERQNCEMETRIADLNQQLADSREAAKFVKALEGMPKGYKLVHGRYFGLWWINDGDDNNKTPTCSTIKKALISAGLMEKAEESNGN